jgi:hypothetical protein
MISLIGSGVDIVQPLEFPSAPGGTNGTTTGPFVPAAPR